MLDLMEEYGSVLVELVVAIIVLRFLMGILFISISDTNMLKESVEFFINTLIGG